jgi:hypothetical protein
MSGSAERSTRGSTHTKLDTVYQNGAIDTVNGPLFHLKSCGSIVKRSVNPLQHILK